MSPPRRTRRWPRDAPRLQPDRRQTDPSRRTRRHARTTADSRPATTAAHPPRPRAAHTRCHPRSPHRRRHPGRSRRRSPHRHRSRRHPQPQTATLPKAPPRAQEGAAPARSPRTASSEGACRASARTLTTLRPTTDRQVTQLPYIRIQAGGTPVPSRPSAVRCKQQNERSSAPKRRTGRIGANPVFIRDDRRWRGAERCGSDRTHPASPYSCGSPALGVRTRVRKGAVAPTGERARPLTAFGVVRGSPAEAHGLPKSAVGRIPAGNALGSLPPPPSPQGRGPDRVRSGDPCPR